MKAVVMDRYGTPDVLEVREVPTPTPKANEVLVRVHAASINDWDYGLLVGTPDYGRWLWWAIEWVYGKVLPGAYAHEHITHFTRASLLAKIREAGFDVLAYRYVGFCELIVQAKKPLKAD